MLKKLKEWWENLMSRLGRGNPFPANSPIISLALSTIALAEGSTTNITINRVSSTLASSVLVYTRPRTAIDSDFTPHNGTLVSFASGETSKTISLNIASDLLYETDETFSIFIANPVNAVLGNRELLVTIEGSPAVGITVVSVTNGSANEGDVIEHTVTMSGTSAATIPFSIVNVTTSNDDYSPTLTFTNGVTRSGSNLIKPDSVSSFKVFVSTIEDGAVEPNETYNLTVGGVSATGTIVNDDSIPAATMVSISSPTVAEGGTLTFNFALSSQSIGQTFAVGLGGTAIGVTDYDFPLTFTDGVTYTPINSTSGTLNVPAGIATFSGSTVTVDDIVGEFTETLSITIAGVVGTGSITDNDASPIVLSELTSIAVFEMPYGMLTSPQKTATETSGGYVGFAASRDSLDAALYDLWYCATISGTYTKVASDVTFTPSGLLAGTIGYDHRTVSIIDEKDFPSSISSTTIGLVADTAGQREFSVLNAYEVITIAGDTRKVLDNAGVGAFDTPPIQVHQDETARMYILTNYALDPALRANGTTGYYKAQPKTSGGTALDLSLVTPVVCSITSRASKPYPPRNVRFRVNTAADYETYPTREFEAADLFIKLDPASKTGETTPSSSFNPSGLNESGVTYHLDIYGVDGLARTLNFDGSYEATYTASDHGTDIDQEITEYRAYAKKGSVRSAEVIVNVAQNVRHAYPEVSSVVLTQPGGAGTNIIATINFDRTRSYPFGVDYTFSGAVFTDGNIGTITVNSNAILEPNERVQIKAGFNSFVMTIPTTSAVGKTLNISVGNADSQQDDSIVIT